jgi:hypothetical protein
MVGCLIAATVASAACHTLKPVTLEQVNVAKPSEVKVTRGDQSIVVVSGPQVIGDTLVGYVNGKFEELPAADLKQVRMKAPARVQTAALIVATAVGIGMFAMLATGSGVFHNPADNLDCDDNPDQVGCQ